MHCKCIKYLNSNSKTKHVKLVVRKKKGREGRREGREARRGLKGGRKKKKEKRKEGREKERREGGRKIHIHSFIIATLLL